MKNWLDDCFPPSRDARLAMRTANSAEMRLSALITPNAPNIAGIRNDEWFVICPLGEHPSPDGSYTQVVSREQAEEVVRTWNSIPGTAARWFKNKWHKLKSTVNGAPGWDGHPETDKNRWPIERQLCEVTDLRVTDTALEGKITWNEKGMERRTRGPLYPSPIFWHFPPDKDRKVFPVLLESIGLVPTANITSVPAWTQNASPEAADNPTTGTNMDRNKLIKALGLGADATDDQILSAIETRSRTANAAIDRNKLIQILGLGAEATNDQIIEKVTGVHSTANAAPDRTKLITVLQLDANTTNEQLAAAVENLRTERGDLSTANAQLVDGLLVAFELAGKVTPAQRDGVKAKFTANGAKITDLVTELQTKKPEINTKHLEVGGTRLDISTANARQSVLESAISRVMKEEAITDRGLAYDKVKADPNYKQLFEAMAQPAKAAA